MDQFNEPIRQNNTQYIYQDTALQRTLLQRIFVWMAFGLAITGLTAYLTYSTNLLYLIASTGRSTAFALFGVQVLLVWFLSSRIHHLSFSVATALFTLYSLLSGVTFGFIFAIYTAESIASTFFITAGTFTAMAIYGYVTKRDLSKMGSILFMGLIGLIIAGVANLFLGSSTLSLITSAVGVLIFTGLTAWDLQNIKHILSEVYEDSEDVKKISLIAALNLYLDFINLFLYLLRLLGSRRD